MNRFRLDVRLVCVVVCLFAGATLLAAPGCGDDEPDGVYVTPAAHDFGRIRHGEVKTQTFTIKNNTGVAVTLAKAVGNCSCIQSSEPTRRRLDPGATAKLTVRLTSGAVPAQTLRGKHLELRVHEPRPHLLRVPIEGDIFAPVVLTIPDQNDKLYFGRIGSEKSHAPRILTARIESGFEAELDTRVERFPHGYAFHPPQLARLFDVTIKEVKQGYDFLVRLKPGVTRPEDIVVRDPKLLYQLVGSITFRIRESGPGLKARTIPHTVGLHGTWPVE